MRKVILVGVAIAAYLSGKYNGLIDAAKTYDVHEFDMAKKRANEITKIFEQHPANNNKFFDWFSQEAQQGFTKEQFEFFRDNYELRTAGTFFSVMHQAMHTAKKGDYGLLPYVMENAREEGGGLRGGEIEPAHMGLCEMSFNMLGSVFGSDPISVTDISSTSKKLLPETIRFREAQEEVYKEVESSEKITGRYLAHEKSASGMLHAFEELFKSYKGYFTEEEYKKMTQYFRAHIPESRQDFGVEDRHGSDAVLVVAASLYRKLNTLVEEQIIQGGNEMLDTQDALWKAMKQRLEELGKSGERVSPKKDYSRTKDDSDIPSKTVTDVQSERLITSKFIAKEL